MHNFNYPLDSVGPQLERTAAGRDRQISPACSDFVMDISGQSFALDDLSDELVLPIETADTLLTAVSQEQSMRTVAHDELQIIESYQAQREALSGKIGEVIARNDLVGFGIPRMRPVWVGRIATDEPSLIVSATVNNVYVGLSVPVKDVYGGMSHSDAKYFGDRAMVSEPHDLDITAFGFVVTAVGLAHKRNYWPHLSVGWGAINKVALSDVPSKLERKHYVAARRFVKRTFTASPLPSDTE